MSSNKCRPHLSDKSALPEFHGNFETYWDFVKRVNVHVRDQKFGKDEGREGREGERKAISRKIIVSYTSLQTSMLSCAELLILASLPTCVPSSDII